MLAWFAIIMATAGPDAMEKKSGLPQLNAQDMAPQLFWLALTFGVLYLVLSRVTLPRIASVIEERRDRIQRDLDEAEKLKSETDAALAAYEQVLAEAHGRANVIARETRDRLTAEVNNEHTKVESDLARKSEEAESRIHAAKGRAMSQVSNIAADAATDVVKKLLGINVSPQDVRSAMQPGAGE